jgi:hypothetical protein
VPRKPHFACLPVGRYTGPLPTGAGRGTIKTIFPPREAPACLSPPDGVAWELHNFVETEQTCRIAKAIYYFSSRFFTIFKSANPPKIIRKIINKFERAKSLKSGPIPHSS